MTTADSARKRILVVAADTAARNLLRRQLQSGGFDVVPAPNLHEIIIGHLPEYAPDVILVNASESRSECLELCTRIKSSSTYRHIPIILLVPGDDAVDQESLIEGRIDEILIAPVTPAELLARVRSMVRIRQQYDELERTIEMRMALSYMIVHDVRNPLAAISLYMQLLKRKAQLQPDEVRYLDLALGEAQKMSSYLDDMLMLAKMERGKLGLSHSPMSIDRLCHSVHDKFAPLAATQNIRLNLNLTPQPYPLMADVTLFQRVLENLVAVALQRGPSHSTILINVSYPCVATNGADEGRTVALRISVCDQGEAIPVEYLDRIFDQLEAVRLKERGRSDLGLELAFCRMVVDAHKGRIFATNNPSHGVTFSVELF